MTERETGFLAGLAVGLTIWVIVEATIAIAIAQGFAHVAR